MPNNNETDSNKYAKYKVKSRSYKSYQFLKHARVYVFPEKTPRPCEFHSNSDKNYTYILNWWIGPFPYILYHSMDSSHKFRNTQYFFLK